MFYPNVQKVSIVVDGTVKKANVCTKCLKAGKVTRG
jgi:large subunit ribosomal protein L28